MEIWFWNDTMHFISPDFEGKTKWAMTCALDVYPGAPLENEINSVVASYLREHGILEAVIDD